MNIAEPHEYEKLEEHIAGGGSATDYEMFIDWIRVWR